MDSSDEPQDYTTRPRRDNECGKACFSSEQAAKRSLRGMSQWRKDEGWKGRAHAFWCQPCRAWHVGHH